MLRGGSSVLGIVNFISFLISIPILGGGIWLASRANSTDCIRFLQWPIIIVGLVLMVISLMGFAGACYRQTWLLRLYLFAMFFVVLALLFFIVFAFAVTDRGDGQVVMNRRFLEYQLSDYSGWLRDRVADPEYWATISACLRDGHACAGMRRFARDSNTGMLVPETPDMFYSRNLSPIQVTAALSPPPIPCLLSLFFPTRKDSSVLASLAFHVIWGRKIAAFVFRLPNKRVYVHVGCSGVERLNFVQVLEHKQACGFCDGSAI